MHGNPGKPRFASLANFLSDSEDPNENHENVDTMEELNSPEIIRMACALCRRRKLKCNRQVPSCDSCIKLQQECVYGVVRIKKATRKDRTQTLEGRLAQIERLLRINDTKKPKNGTGRQPSPASQPSNDESAEVEEDTVRELLVFFIDFPFL